MFHYLLLIGLINFYWVAASTLNTKGLLPIPDERIVGGLEANIESFPYQVSLRYFSWHRCGGSIIKKDAIITAAHCVHGIPLINLAFGAGSSDVTKYGAIRKLKKVTVHESYNDWTLDFDVAVVRLEKGFDFSPKIQPIFLASVNEELRAGTKVIVSGWGTTQENGAEPEILRYVAINVISHEDCSNFYNMFGVVTENMLCAGTSEGGKDACQGDSGGPLVVANKLFGIVSWGKGCARPDYPGVYTKVASIRAWIDGRLLD